MGEYSDRCIVLYRFTLASTDININSRHDICVDKMQRNIYLASIFIISEACHVHEHTCNMKLLLNTKINTRCASIKMRKLKIT